MWYNNEDVPEEEGVSKLLIGKTFAYFPRLTDEKDKKQIEGDEEESLDNIDNIKYNDQEYVLYSQRIGRTIIPLNPGLLAQSTVNQEVIDGYLNEIHEYVNKYSILTEYSLLLNDVPSNFYCLPESDDVLRWDMFITIHSSYYKNGKFKLIMDLGVDYPRSVPTVTFLSPIYHPLVNAKTGKLNLGSQLNQWDMSIHSISVVCLYIKNIFYLRDDYPEEIIENEEAYFLFNNDRELFIKKVQSSVEESNRCLYKKNSNHMFNFERDAEDSSSVILDKFRSVYEDKNCSKKTEAFLFWLLNEYLNDFSKEFPEEIQVHEEMQEKKLEKEIQESHRKSHRESHRSDKKHKSKHKKKHRHERVVEEIKKESLEKEEESMENHVNNNQENNNVDITNSIMAMAPLKKESNTEDPNMEEKKKRNAFTSRSSRVSTENIVMIEEKIKRLKGHDLNHFLKQIQVNDENPHTLKNASTFGNDRPVEVNKKSNHKNKQHLEVTENAIRKTNTENYLNVDPQNDRNQKKDIEANTTIMILKNTKAYTKKSVVDTNSTAARKSVMENEELHSELVDTDQFPLEAMKRSKMLILTKKPKSFHIDDYIKAKKTKEEKNDESGNQSIADPLHDTLMKKEESSMQNKNINDKTKQNNIYKDNKKGTPGNIKRKDLNGTIKDVNEVINKKTTTEIKKLGPMMKAPMQMDLKNQEQKQKNRKGPMNTVTKCQNSKKLNEESSLKVDSSNIGNVEDKKEDNEEKASFSDMELINGVTLKREMNKETAEALKKQLDSNFTEELGN